MFIECELTEKEFDALEKFYKDCVVAGVSYDVSSVLNRLLNSQRCLGRHERNKEIFERRQTGTTYQEIADEFGISKERVRQICLKEARNKAYYRQLADAKQPHDKFYNALLLAAKDDERDSRLVTRIYNILTRSKTLDSVLDGTIDLENDYSELMNLYGFGVTQLELCRKARSIYNKMVE